MNDFSTKALLLWAALKQHEATPIDWRQGLLDGMFWLTEQLLTRTEGRPEHGYIKTIQQYIERAFKHPEHKISDMALELCSRIVSGIPDDGDHA